MTFRRKTNATVLCIALAGFAGSCLRSAPLTEITIEIDPAVTSDRKDATEKTVAVIEHRLNLMGVSNFEVKPQGEPTSGRIRITLPQVSDSQRLVALITTPAKFEMVPVINPPSPAPLQTYDTEIQAQSAAKGSGIVTHYKPGNISSDTKGSFIILEKTPILSGSDLSSAKATRNGDSDIYSIVCFLKSEAANRLVALSGSRINSYIAFVLDGEVKSISNIKSQISDQVEIPVAYAKEAAMDLALVLNSGALAARVKSVDESVIR